MKTIFALISGLLFGFGLMLSGMTNPAKVQGFLDITGQWDPSLGLVMVGAIAVAFFGFRAAKQREQRDASFHCELPKQTKITFPLIAGAALFGIGWGLTGICPGPALVALGLGFWPAFLVVVAMLSGFVIANRIQR